MGSNMGSRRQNLLGAEKRLRALACAGRSKRSKLFENPAVGGPGGQRDFQNAVLRFETRLTPEELLERMLVIELEFGRDRSQTAHMGPRPLDLDLLLLGDERRATPTLELPHPRMLQRDFVLKPLAEIAPNLILPQNGLTAREAWAQLKQVQAHHS